MKQVILLLLSVITIALSASGQAYLAPEIGLNLATMKIKDPPSIANTSVKPGLLLGLNCEIALKNNFYLQPGIFYKMTGTASSEPGNTKVKVNTVELPINVYYKFFMPHRSQLAVGIGVYVAMNISAKESWSAFTDASGTSYAAGSEPLNIGSVEPNPSGQNGDDLKLIDFGMSGNVAYVLRGGLFVHARCQFGLTNLDPSAAGNPGVSIRTQAYSISIGHYLNYDRVAQKHKPAAKKNLHT